MCNINRLSANQKSIKAVLLLKRVINRGYYTACACIWFLFTSYEHLSRTNEWAKRTSEWVINVHNEWIKTIYTNKPCNNLFIIYYRVLQWNNFAYRFFHCSEKDDITNQISHIVFFTAYRFYREAQCLHCAELFCKIKYI